MSQLSQASLQGPFGFSYDEFEEWYAQLESALLEPAKTTFVRILSELLETELSATARSRIRISAARVKRPARIWVKMLAPRYVSRIGSLDDIPAIIDDLVGVRVTCNNLSDVDTFREVIVGMHPYDPTEAEAGLCIDPESERHHNKASGYRAYHINLHTLVASARQWKHATGELQVRTLLQDGWGELTHEDTYKPGSEMPKLILRLSKRMADLLAAVDDLAQDLRDELDSLAAGDAGVSTEKRKDETENVTPGVDAGLTSALFSETRSLVAALDRPTPLADLAQRLQASFGRELSATWGSYGSFKALLLAAVPTITIQNTPPGLIIPPGFPLAQLAEATAIDGDNNLSGVPHVILRLRARDQNLPAVPAERLAVYLTLICSSLSSTAWRKMKISEITGIREVNLIARYARDLGSDQNTPTPRHGIDYLLKCLYFSGNLRKSLTLAEAGEIIEAWLYARAASFGYATDPTVDRDAIGDWIADAIDIAGGHTKARPTYPAVSPAIQYENGNNSTDL